MISFVRRQLSVTNLMVVAALTFAMAGGAVAATGGHAHVAASKHKKGGVLITSVKQISPTVLKALTGKAGPAGLEGKAGSEGKAGAQGLQGAAGGTGGTGEKGAPGESVSVTSLPAKSEHCAEGGSEFTVAAKHTYACTGSPWPAGGTLPTGQSETGTWSVFAIPGKYVLIENVLELEYAPAAISFEIPLKTALAEASVHFIKEEVTEAEDPSGCKGKLEISEAEPTKPEAEPGNLCVFEHSGSINTNNEGVTFASPETASGGASSMGTVMHIPPATKGAATNSETIGASGVWVLTAS
jgi:hypothetical protein